MVIIDICQVSAILSIILACPYCILPSKDGIQSLILPDGTKFTDR